MTFDERYRAAFTRYIAERDERVLTLAYELGRDSVREGLSVLELSGGHHDALAAALETVAPDDVPDAIRAAGEFFCEALSAFEMVRRVLREERAAAALERRQTGIVRQLSSFLADASLAVDAGDSLEEILQLVAEHAREVVGAGRCRATLALEGDVSVVVACEEGEECRRPASGPSLSAPLTALDGRVLGVVELFDKRDGAFSTLDQELLGQLAQMASAAIERMQLYQG